MVNSKWMGSVSFLFHKRVIFNPFSCHNSTIYLHNPNACSTSEMNLTDLFCHQIPVLA